MRKSAFILRDLILGMMSRRIRFALTVLGIFTGTFIFALGLVLTGAWYRTQTEEAGTISGDSILVMGENSKLDGIGILQRSGDADSTLYMQENISRTLLRTTLPGGKTFLARATLLGLAAGDLKGVSRSVHESSVFPTVFRLKAGRAILNTDIRSGTPAAVIDAFTERLLFGEGEGLGQTITLSSDVGAAGAGAAFGTIALTVVGIAEDDYYTGAQPRLLRSAYYGEDETVSVDLRIYVPASILDERFTTPVYVLGFPDEDACRSAEQLLGDIQAQYAYYGSYTVNSRQSILERMETDTAYIRRVLFLVMAVVLAMSALSILSIQFFSTKERFTEIGIRKAFGASGGEIAAQFVLEAALQGIICSMAAFGAAYLASAGFQELISERFSLYFHLRFRASDLFLTMVTGVLLSVVSSLLPAMYAARIPVVEAMRLE